MATKLNLNSNISARDLINILDVAEMSMKASEIENEELE